MGHVIVSLGLVASLTIGGLADRAHFVDVVQAHFAAWDLNHDGRLEGQEIDKLMTRRSIRGEAAAALAVLKLRERQTPAPERPGFTLSPGDIDDLDRHGSPTVAVDKARKAPHAFHAESTFKRYTHMLESLVPRLYAGSGPDFPAMKQGPIGDCYLFCLTGYLAARHPAKIRQMIVVEPNGNFVVRFPDGEEFPVSAPTEAELLVNNSASSLADGIWLCVLEKAIGERMRRTARDPANRTAEATDAMAAGGSTGMIIPLYSGHKARSIKLRDGRESAARLQELRRELPATLAHGRMASVEMGNEPPGQPKIPGLGYHHAYAILAFDPKSDRVTVWNPWGQHFQPKGPEGLQYGFAAEHGIFHIPLTILYHQFSTVHLETTEPATVGQSPRHKAPRRR